MPKKPNILYSANCLLANLVCERYYNGLHYVWCSTAFGSPGSNMGIMPNPASSIPYERYRRLEKDVGPPGDLHSSMIAAQRTGIKYGATQKLAAGKITQAAWDEIVQIADEAACSDFAPLMYLIPYDKVKRLIKAAPLHSRAHPFSDEWIIEELPSDSFDIQRY